VIVCIPAPPGGWKKGWGGQIKSAYAAFSK